MRKDGSGTSFFDTIIASTATVTDRFDASNRNFDALTYASPDLGYGPVIFYYLSHDNAGVSTFGSITPGGVVGVTTDHFVVGNNFDAVTFSATDVGYGADLFYYVRHDATGLSTFGTIDPTPGGIMTDRFTVGTNVDALVFTDLIAPGYGPNNFYYLRHDASGISTFGTIHVTGLTAGTVTDRFAVGTNATELTFTATDAAFGPNLFYFLRGGLNLTTNTVTTLTTNTVPVVTTNTIPSFTTNTVTTFTTNSVPTVTTNTVTTFTTNTVTTFTTNTVTTFTTNTIPTVTTNTVRTLTTNTVTAVITNIVPRATANTVTARGTDTCEGRTVTAAADCSGPVAPSASLVTGTPTMANGVFSLSFPTENGKSYTVQYKNALTDPTWTELETVAGTGGTLSITDAAAAHQPTRFYRIMSTP